jgi:hypothetical protein
VLAKAPDFADYLLALALASAGFDPVLTPLDDSVERQTAELTARLRR